MLKVSQQICRIFAQYPRFLSQVAICFVSLSTVFAVHYHGGLHALSEHTEPFFHTYSVADSLFACPCP